MLYFATEPHKTIPCVFDEKITLQLGRWRSPDHTVWMLETQSVREKSKGEHIMKFKKTLASVLCAAMMVTMVAGCGTSTSQSSDSDASETLDTAATSDTAAATDTAKSSGDYADTITLVWYPNESAEDYEVAREEYARLIEQATGKKVEQKLTTDYAIAIEALANGTAQICFMGAQGYIEAKAANDAVEPLFVNSGASGTLDDALYYSFLAVNKGSETEYADGDSYSIDNIEGKRMSFVSNSSTSGFKVPTSSIIGHFADMNLTEDDLVEGGEGMLFSQVLFGGSHQGSAFNLLSGKADVAAFCDTEIAPYAHCVEGEANATGSVYAINDDASDPFSSVTGKEFVIIQSTPVLNGPFAYNSEALDPDDVKAIQDLFTSDEVAENELIFVPEDSDGVGMFEKTDSERFVLVEDSWFDPIRDLSK